MMMDTYCEWCLEDTDDTQLTDVDGYKSCQSCLPIAYREFWEWDIYLMQHMVYNEAEQEWYYDFNLGDSNP